MVKAVILIIAFLSLSPAQLNSQHDAHNGFWWKGLAAWSKLIYVIGFTERTAQADTTWVVLQHESKSKLPTQRADAARGANDYSGTRVGDGLDVFYTDFKNSSIHVSDAIYVVKEQTKGTNQKALDEYVLRLRKSAAMPSYDSP